MNLRFGIFSLFIYSVLGDPYEILRTIKRLRKEIIILNKNPFLTVEDHKEVENTQKYLLNLKNLTDNIDYEYDSLYEYENELYELEEKIEKLFFKIRHLEQKENTDKCIKMIKGQNYDDAAILISSVTDFELLTSIVNQTEYNMLSVIDKIPSISLSFKILKILNNLNLKFEPKLLTLLSLKRNVFDQISSSEKERAESLTLMDEIRTEITEPLVEKCTNFLKNGDNEIQEITHIICASKDFKFYKTIWTPIFSNQTIKYGQIKNFVEEGQILILDTFFHELLKKGIKGPTVKDLILIIKDIKKVINKTNGEFKNYYSVPDIKYNLIKEFELSFLGQYYSLPLIDYLSMMTYNGDRHFFMEVIQEAVNLVYGKMKTVFLIKTISESSSLGQTILGYKAVFNIMKEKDDLYVADIFRGKTILIFNQFVKETIQKAKNAEDDLKRILDDVHIGLVKYTKVGVYQETPYTLEYFKERLQIKEYDASYIVEEMIGIFLENKVIEDFYQHLEFYNDYEFMLNMILLDEKLKYFGIKNTNIYVFEVAERYKKFITSQAYIEVDSKFKMGCEKAIKRLPKTVRNVVFEVNFIKNNGGYLHADGEEVTVSKKNRSKFIFVYAGGPGLYNIRNKDNYVLVDENRKVFLNANIHNESAKWKLLPASNGIYIKNNFFNEYFYAGGKIDTKKRRAEIFKGGSLPVGAPWTLETVLDDD